MAIGGSLRELGRFVDDCERGDRTVTAFELSDADGDGEPALAGTVDLSVDASLDREAGVPALESPRLDSSGRLRFALGSMPRLVPTTDCDVSVTLLDATLDLDGTLTATLRVTPGEVGGEAVRDPTDPAVAAPAGEAESPVPAEDDPDVPPFKDPDLLAEVYGSCETFAEMAQTIDMDVTAETVRRYMIDYDIHQPNTYRTGDGDEPAEPEAADGQSASATEGPSAEPIVLSDGIGLPDDVTVETLIDTVKRSNTIYEVTREVNVDRADALEMLDELNLLDLVVGRLATEGERDINRDEIVDRLREAPGTQ
jgi:hypothetical protein